MKRILSLILVLTMLITMLASCSTVDTDTNSDTDNTIDTSEDTNDNTSIDTGTDTNANTSVDTTTDTDTKINPGEILDLIDPDKEVNKEKGFLFQRPYRSFRMVWTDEAREWSWDELSAFEKYTRIEIGKVKYFSTKRTIDEELLGDCLGEHTAFGYSHHFSSSFCEDVIEHTETFKAYEIKDISSGICVAVKIEDKYYVYRVEIEERPKTLGEFLELYNLEKTLNLRRFNDTREEKNTNYALENDDYVWEMLYSCEEGSLCNNDGGLWNITGDYLQFTATSEQLGTYKKVLYITENGYIKTNLLEYAFVYYIGEEQAQKIIDYVRANSQETLNDKYEYNIVGIVTEIGDGYMLIDDSTFCKNEDDGMVFRVSTEEMKIQRKCRAIDEGDIVAVFFELDRNNAEDGIIDNPKTLSICGMYGDDYISVHQRYE